MTTKISRLTAPFDMAEWVTATRREQNLSDRIEDEAVLANVRQLMAPDVLARSERAA